MFIESFANLDREFVLTTPELLLAFLPELLLGLRLPTLFGGV